MHSTVPGLAALGLHGTKGMHGQSRCTIVQSTVPFSGTHRLLARPPVLHGCAPVVFDRLALKITSDRVLCLSLAMHKLPWPMHGLEQLL